MNKILIVLLFSILLFGNQLEEHNSFEKEVVSSLLKTDLKIYIKEKKVAIVTKKIRDVFKIVEKYNFCKNHNYSILPKYNLNRFLFYYTNLSFECKLKKENLNKFSELLSRLEVNYRISLYNFHYFISPKVYKESIKNLKIEAFQYGLKRANILSNSFHKKCFMNYINFYNNPINRVFRKSVQLSSSSIITPTEDKKRVKIDVNYRFVCF